MAEKSTKTADAFRAALSEIKQSVDTILNTTWLRSMTPEPMLVYKPRLDKKTNKPIGKALKLQLRIAPTFGHDSTGGVYVAQHSGGLFVEVVQQTGVNPDNGTATFGWAGDEHRSVAKLGVPDISALLLGYQRKRLLGQPIPPPFCGNDTKGERISLIHTSESGSTVIMWAFTDKGSFFRVMRKGGNDFSISLSFAEEILFENYLRMALTTFQSIGGR